MVPSVNEKDLLFEELRMNGVLDSIFASALIAFSLLIVALNCWINRTRKKRQKLSWKELLEHLLEFKRSTSLSRVSKIALGILFFRLFLMLYRLLVANAMQTMKVLIDSSQIITNPEQLLISQYELCLPGDPDLHQILKAMPPGSLYRRTYERHLEKGACLFGLSEGGRIDFTNKVRCLKKLSNLIESFKNACFL